MKKITLSIVILLLGLSMQGGMVRAEMLNTNVKALDTAETAALQKQINILKAAVADLQMQVVLRRSLKQTLDIVTALMPQVKSKLENPNLTAREKVMIGGGLAGISGRLLAVRETLSAPAALKSVAVASPLPRISARPMVVQESETVKKSEESPVAAVSNANEKTDEPAEAMQTASLSEKGQWYAPLAVVLVLVGIGAFLWWRGRERKEEIQTLPQS